MLHPLARSLEGEQAQIGLVGGCPEDNDWGRQAMVGHRDI